ncbi:hypothetical protein [Nitrospirillum iridis]|uniref:Uncharacterized protein n=1 Tax=Nitrospirillum iridis TaxID=765888 RepID=A0A7X0EC95_9PROT|nr:hypothetical protein [Nitrospirillum iridis]MBB6251398.1 hypothetical protein [Nitrospirillum iridis]
MTPVNEQRLTSAAADMSEAIGAVIERHNLDAHDFVIVMAIPVGGVLATTFPNIDEREAALNRFRRCVDVAATNAVRARVPS